MTVTIDITPGEEAWLAEQSAQQGLPPATIIKQLIDAQLPGAEPTEPGDASLNAVDPTQALFTEWDKVDACRTPEQVANDNDLWQQFEAGINATRRTLGMRQL
jgi:hypothetical protein